MRMSSFMVTLCHYCMAFIVFNSFGCRIRENAEACLMARQAGFSSYYCENGTNGLTIAICNVSPFPVLVQMPAAEKLDVTMEFSDDTGSFRSAWANVAWPTYWQSEYFLLEGGGHQSIEALKGTMRYFDVAYSNCVFESLSDGAYGRWPSATNRICSVKIHFPYWRLPQLSACRSYHEMGDLCDSAYVTAAPMDESQKRQMADAMSDMLYLRKNVTASDIQPPLCVFKEAVAEAFFEASESLPFDATYRLDGFTNAYVSVSNLSPVPILMIVPTDNAFPVIPLCGGSDLAYSHRQKGTTLILPHANLVLFDGNLEPPPFQLDSTMKYLPVKCPEGFRPIWGKCEFCIPLTYLPFDTLQKCDDGTEIVQLFKTVELIVRP